jgi:hypothetical protein
MSTLGPYYVGPTITINVLRSFILDHRLSDDDTVLLHPDDFDTLALEYRATYRKALREPYFLLGVLIEPALDHAVPLTRVMALISDQRPHRLSLAIQHGPLTDDGRPIHRCGFCGTFTDAHGYALTGDDLILHTRLLKARGWPERAQHLVGHCCQHR